MEYTLFNSFVNRDVRYKKSSSTEVIKLEGIMENPGPRLDIKTLLAPIEESNSNNTNEGSVFEELDKRIGLPPIED